MLAYTPRSQFLPLHNRTVRWASINTHRRAGKTVALINDLILGTLECRLHNPQFAYIGPTYAQSKRIAWAYLKEFAASYLAKPPQEAELKVTLKNGAVIYVLGADNADSLRGMYLDGAVLDEYTLFRPSVFSQVIRPALSDRLGWAIFASTPRGKNLFYDIHRAAEKDPATWYSLTLRADTSRLIPQHELDDLRADMDPEEFAQEYLCSFDAALKGAIYADQVNEMFSDGRVTAEDLYDPAMPINWAFDIGYTDATVCIGFQFTRDLGVNIVTVDVTQGKPIHHHISKITNFAGELGDVWLPHDAKAKSSQTGKSIVEMFVAQGIRPRGVPQHNVRDGLAAARAMFPRIRISEPMTGELVEALKAYRREWDDMTMMFTETPVHDWASDYADAFRYMCLAAGIMEPRALLRKETEETARPSWIKPFMVDVNLDTMFTEAENRGKILRID